MGGVLAHRKKIFFQKKRIVSDNKSKFDKWKRNGDTIPKEVLLKFYNEKKKSMQEISNILHCSLHKVAYWMGKYKIQRRKRGDAIYVRCNPNGDPFQFRLPQTIKEAELFGLGIGLYWGEGNKKNKYSIRLGNSDPALIRKFMDFLRIFFNIEKDNLQFGLQIFSDIDIKVAMDFWIKTLTINKHQFYKVIVTKSGKLGTYREKSLYGVMTVHFHNKKAKEQLCKLLPM